MVAVAEAMPVAAQRADPSAPVLALTGLAKAFGKIRVLDGIDLAVRSGEAVALIGSNGTGKSTLLRCCLRLIEPTGGTIRLLDRDVMALRPTALRALRADVGFVFQRHNLVPSLSALSNVVHGAQSRRSGPRTWLQGLAPQALRAEALQCLERVGLADLAGRRVDHLSGGQSQRVAIARALMQRPRFVMADEPVASLDPSAGEEVMDLLVGLLRTDGVTLLFTSHNLHHALAYADRVVGLRGGGVGLDAPARSQNVEDLRHLYD